MDLYNDDKGERVRQMLEVSGFNGVKIWEQPMNVHYKDGEDFVQKFGHIKLDAEAKSNDLSPELA